MRRALIATAGTAAALAALLSYKSSNAIKPSHIKVGAGVTPPPASGTTPTTTISSPPSTGSSSGPTAGPTTTTTSNRVITGNDVQYNYGDIQLRVTIDNKKITKIDVVQNGAIDRRSQRINSEAVPILTQEALAAQGLNFDIVSGATFTSEAFAQSLQSAIDPSGNG